MDTKFWGPSGWRLLHLITFAYTPKKKDDVRRLFESLAYVLPCKFCRASFQEYIDEDPVEPALRSKATLSKWLWRIHNRVNEKLRGQGLLHGEDPSYESVRDIYEERLKEAGEFEGWDFLFSVAENHPYCRLARQSLPMKECPTVVPLHSTLRQKNKWNVLSCDERMAKYKVFWHSLEGSLPFEEWRLGWKSCKINYDLLDKRVDLLKELWRFRCCMREELDETFDGMCKKLANHRSGCSKNPHAKTCRKKRS
jgi:hypothetical protein